MKYYKKRNYRKIYKKKRNATFGSIFRERARRNFVKLVKETLATQNEKKQFAAIFNTAGGNAGSMYTSQLTDIETGNDNNHRIGNEVLGNKFDVLLTMYNKANSDMYVRVALLELDGIGATGNIDRLSDIFESPNGNATSYDNAVGIAANAAVMWPYYQKGAVKVLREKIVKLPKNNGGSSSSSRTIKWLVPWAKKIKYISPTQQGANAQNKRVTLVLTAWSPEGGTQTSYEYENDGLFRFYYQDG